MDDLLLLHILTGEATAEEKEAFYSYLENNEEEKELFFRVKKLWLLTSKPDPAFDPDQGFERVWSKLSGRDKKKLPVLKIFRYAAVFALILGFGGALGYFLSISVFEKNAQNKEAGFYTYSATRGSVSIVEFPDGSRVWLNSESKVSYREDSKTKQRLAELTGEAYFEIVHNDDHPFLVRAGEITVRDLGTTFNIKAYPEDHYIETSLVEGEADILALNGKSIVTLNPGESAMYLPNTKNIVLRSIASNVLSAWRDGKFVVRDQRLEDIFKELSRWYGIEFQFNNEELKDYRFTGNIKKSTTALHVLNVLKLTTNFNYRIVEKIDAPDLVIVY